MLNKNLYKIKLFAHNLKYIRESNSERCMATLVDYPLPTLSTNDFKERLKKHNLPFTEGHTCFRLHECNLCIPYKRPTQGKSSEIFVNKQTGYFLCELCKCSGSWQSFEQLVVKSQKSDSERGVKEVQSWRDGCVSYHDKGVSWKKMNEDLQKLSSYSETDQLSIYSSFKLPACPPSVADRLNILLSPDRQTMYLPIISSTQLVLGHISLNNFGKTGVVPKSDCAGFITYTVKRKSSKAVIVSNLHDFFSLLSSNLANIHILCLPYGVSNLPQISLPFLEDYENLILWFGSGPGAWDATRNFAKKLNEKRCCVIRSSDPCLSSPADAVLSGSDIKKMMEQALPTWHQAITTFSSLRDDVLQELRNHEQVMGVQWKRFPPLNKILRGHRRGELTILTGPTGSGKTTFMSEYSLDLASQGINTLWGSFEVRNVRLARTMLQQHVGLPLEENLESYENWATEFEHLPVYFLTFHGQQSIKTVMDAVQHASYVHDIGHVIIDNVQFMIGMTDDHKYQDRFLKQDLIIHAFRTFATRSNCHVTLVIHPRKERDTDDLTTASIFGGAKAAQEADNVLIIQDKRLTTARGKKYLQVCKNRYTGDLGMMVLNFDKESLSYGRLKKDLKTPPPVL